MDHERQHIGVQHVPREPLTADLLERFASTIAGRHDRLLLIRSDNNVVGTPWPTSGIPQESFAVLLADGRGYRTLALDVDDGRVPSPQTDTLADLLREAGIHYVHTRSGPSGHHHVLATFISRIPPAAMARFARHLKQREFFSHVDVGMLLNPSKGAVRPPLAAHRLGGRSEIIDADPLDALAILEEGNPPDTFRVLARLVGCPILTDKMETLLREGDIHGCYRTRSEAEMAIALAHVNGGGMFATFRADLLDPNNAVGAKTRSIPNPDRYLHHTWEKAQNRAHTSPPITNRVDAKAQVARVRAAMEHYFWNGKAGMTNMAVLLAMCAVAEKAGKLAFDADARTLAEMAKVSRDTVTLSQKRLQRLGWLVRTGRRTAPEQASTWRVRIPRGRSLPSGVSGYSDTRTYPQGGFEDRMSDLPEPPPLAPEEVLHDLWRWRRGAGKSAYRVWVRLDPAGPCSLRGLSTSLSVGRSTVHEHLKRLEALGLARHESGGWVRGEKTLDEVAEFLEADKVSALQRTRHASERLLFHAYRAFRMKLQAVPSQKGKSR